MRTRPDRPTAAAHQPLLLARASQMEYLTVPCVLVFRALTPLVTALFAIPILGDRLSMREWISLLLIVVGALCYLVTDPSFSILGYAWMIANLVSAAAYHVYVRSPPPPSLSARQHTRSRTPPSLCATMRAMHARPLPSTFRTITTRWVWEY